MNSTLLTITSTVKDDCEKYKKHWELTEVFLHAVLFNCRCIAEKHVRQKLKSQHVKASASETIY